LFTIYDFDIEYCFPQKCNFLGENISYHSWCLMISNFATSN
jgi:hypothetical protein